MLAPEITTYRLQGSSEAPVVAEAVYHSLEALADLTAYQRWTYNVVKSFIGECVCDVGCGNGNFLRFLSDRQRVIGIDPFSSAIEAARRRFAGYSNVELVHAALEDCPNERIPPGSFDTVTCLRLLDSMEDDIGAVERMGRLCRPGGFVVIVASAHRSAYGALDRAFGHRRRYSRRALRNVFQAGRLSVTFSRFMNAPGYFGWLWYSRLLGCKQLPSGGAAFVNRVAPFLEQLEGILHPPFGQSIVMVGRRD